MADDYTSRRGFLAGAASAAGGLMFVTVLPREGRATPETMAAAIKKAGSADSAALSKAAPSATTEVRVNFPRRVCTVTGESR